MADFADDASAVTEMNLQVALQNAKGQGRTHPFTGICRHCDELLTKGAFCDSFCRDDYQKRMRNINYDCN